MINYGISCLVNKSVFISVQQKKKEKKVLATAASYKSFAVPLWLKIACALVSCQTDSLFITRNTTALKGPRPTNINSTLNPQTVHKYSYIQTKYKSKYICCGKRKSSSLQVLISSAGDLSGPRPGDIFRSFSGTSYMDSGQETAGLFSCQCYLGEQIFH